MQAVSRPDGTVTLYSVTSCSSNFRPSFRVPGQTGETGTIVLYQDVMSDVLPRTDDPGVRANYNTGNTANSYFYDEWYGGNPSSYKTYIWGVNDACPGDEGLENTYAVAGYPTLKRFLTAASHGIGGRQSRGLGIRPSSTRMPRPRQQSMCGTRDAASKRG